MRRIVMAKSNFSSGGGFGEELSPGVRVGGARYVLKRMLGRGENSEVWLAQDVKAGKEVALKFLPAALLSDANVVERLKQEAQRNFLLVHPHIASTYEFMRNFSSVAIATEYVEGWSLATFKIDKPQQRYRVEEIEWWIRQLGAALDFAHNECGIIHRDLKPANLLVNAKDELKVTDFGIAASVRGECSRRGLAGSGGLGFMSPQQVMGAEPSWLDDIYSLGATIFDLLTSTPPFYKGEIITQICGLKAPSMKERLRELGIADDAISPVWEDAVAACLAKNPADRPQSVKEVLQLIERSELPKPVEPPVEIQTEVKPVATETAVEPAEEIELIEVNETEADEDNPFAVEFVPETPVPPPAKNLD
jgi:serine/threonine protein kinase